MKVSSSSARQNCCLIGYSSLGDKESCALCCLLIMYSFYLVGYAHICVYEGVGWWWGDLDKTNDQTVKHTDDISLSFSSWTDGISCVGFGFVRSLP